MRGYELVNASTIESALAHLRTGRTTAADDWPVRVKAAGIDLLDQWKEGTVRPQRVVSLAWVPGLAAVTAGREGLTLGPLCTLASLARAPALRGPFAALAEAAVAAATPQIRARATLGGNLCQRPRCPYYRRVDFPCLRKGGSTCFAQAGEHRWHAVFGNGACAMVHPSSAAVALLALDARLTLRVATGSREVGLEAFFVGTEGSLRRENVLGPEELVASVALPAAAPGTRSAYGAVKEKQSFDWALVEVAVALTLQGGRIRGARVAMGGVAATPLRAAAVEKTLLGQAATGATFAAAARRAAEGATPLAGNGHKIPIAEALVRRTLARAAGVAP